MSRHFQIQFPQWDVEACLLLRHAIWDIPTPMLDTVWGLGGRGWGERGNYSGLLSLWRWQWLFLLEERDLWAWDLPFLATTIRKELEWNSMLQTPPWDSMRYCLSTDVGHANMWIAVHRSLFSFLLRSQAPPRCREPLLCWEQVPTFCYRKQGTLEIVFCSSLAPGQSYVLSCIGLFGMLNPRHEWKSQGEWAISQGWMYSWAYVGDTYQSSKGIISVLRPWPCCLFCISFFLTIW